MPISTVFSRAARGWEISNETVKTIPPLYRQISVFTQIFLLQLSLIFLVALTSRSWAQPEVMRFSDDFESYTPGVGNLAHRWDVTQPSVAGVMEDGDAFAGRGQAGYIGFGTTGETFTGAWNSVLLWESDISSTPRPVVRAAMTFAIQGSTNDRHDPFSIEIYDKSYNQICQLWFLGDSTIRQIHRRSSSAPFSVSTGYEIQTNTPYDLVLELDYRANRWTATIGGIKVVDNQPLFASGTTKELGYLNIAMYPSDPNARGNNFLYYDDVKVDLISGPYAYITSHPSSAVRNEGEMATFEVTAVGEEPFQYQWFRNNEAIGNAVNATYTIPSVASSDSASYHVVINNAHNSPVTSEPANLIVQTPGTRWVLHWGRMATQGHSPPSGVTNWRKVVISRQFEIINGFALREDDSVIGWGYNHLALGTIPSGLRAIDIAAGQVHAVAARTDGTVVCWGDNYSGQATPPALLTDGSRFVVSVSAGYRHTVAMTDDGFIHAWGSNTRPSSGWSSTYAGQIDAPTNGGYKAISAGAYHNLAINANGGVYAWGANHFGQRNLPFGLSSGVIAVAAGDQHSLALKSDGTVVAWGSNATGECNVPVGLNNVVAIDAGDKFSAALKADGTIVTWGDNNFGPLNVPSGLSDVRFMAAGGYSMVAIVGDTFTPRFAVQPSDTETSFGGPATLTAKAFVPLMEGQIDRVSYEWHKGTAGINYDPVGTASGRLELANITNTATYWTRALSTEPLSGSIVGQQISRTATVTPNPAPISLTPAQTVHSYSGGSVRLEVAFGGAGPFTLEWWKDGIFHSAATEAEPFLAALDLPEVNASDFGAYTLVISNMHGTASSQVVTLALLPFSWSNPVGGVFSEAGNWSTAEVPGVGHDARFRLTGPYEVSLGESQTASRLLFEQGFTSIDANGFTLQATNTATFDSIPSLVVGMEADHQAEVEFSNGALLTRQVQLGKNADSTGSLTINGGASMLTEGFIYAGYRGAGNLTVTEGGTVTASGNPYIARHPGSSGSITVSGADSRFSSPALYAGRGGTGASSVIGIYDGGFMTINGSLVMSENQGSDSKLIIANQDSRVAFTSTLTAGQRGGCLITIADGGVMEGLALNMSTLTGSSSELTITGPGSRLELAGSATISAGNHPAELRIEDGGTMKVANNLNMGGAGRLTISGGELILDSMVAQSGAIIELNAGTLTFPEDRNISGITSLSRFLGSDLVLNSGRQLNVEGALIIDDDLNVDGGTLRAQSLADSTNLLFNSGLLIVPGGVTGSLQVPLDGTFNGGGIITANVFTSGTIIPSLANDGPAVLQIMGDFDQSTTGNLVFHLITNGGVSHSILKVEGTANFSGTLTLLAAEPLDLNAGDKIALLDLSGPITGSFSILNLPSPGAGLAWDASGLTVDGSLEVIPANAIIDIPDAALLLSLQSLLGIGNSPVTVNGILTLESLDLTNLGIADLSGLEFALNLTSLDLSGNEITDLAALLPLTSLQHVTLEDNPIKFSDSNTAGQLFALSTGGVFVAPMSQKIIFEPLENMYPEAGETIDLIAEASSGLPIVFNLSDGSLGTVEGTQLKLNIEQHGNLSVSAMQTGNAFFLPAAPVEQVLDVQPAQPYRNTFQDWVVLNDLPETMRGPHDRNGPLNLPNLLAYAMALDPNTATPADLPQVGAHDAEAGTVTFSYRRATDTPGTTLKPVVSSDLADWQDADTGGLAVLETQDDWEQVELTLPAPPSGRLFLRLEAQLNP